MILLVLIAAIAVAAKWRVFQKMGYEGWKSLIPVYETFLTFKAIYGSGWMMLVLIAPFVMALPISIIMAIGMFLSNEVTAIIGVPVMIIGLLLGVASAVLPVIFTIKLNFDMARAFRQSKAFGFGLWLVNPVMMVVLAFSNAAFRDVKMVAGDDVISCLITKVDTWIRSGRKEDTSDLQESLRTLKELHEDGVIDDALYARKRTELINRL